MKLDIALHPGASFVGGPDQIHIWADSSQEIILRSRWQQRVADAGIAKPLTIRSRSGAGLHAHASGYPFLSLRFLGKALGETPDPGLDRQLDDLGRDAWSVENIWGIYRTLALRRGWPAWPLMIDRMPGVILGIGRLHCVVAMNMGTTATALMGVAGMSKAAGRDLLPAYGIPVAPGGGANTPEAAVSKAEELGWPVVLKRVVGGNSDGVIVGLASAEECREAAVELLKGCDSLIVEKKIPGIELRVHVAGGRIEQTLLRVPSIVVADGISTVRQLIGQRRPRYLEMADKSPYYQSQMVYRCWNCGVRTFADLTRVVPPAGRRLDLGKEFHVFRDAAMERSALHQSDRRRIESFLKACGSPGGALDIIVAHAGVPLAEGGAVLEINAPSGRWYLRDSEKTASRELDAWIASKPGFRRSRGRIPFWIAPGRLPGHLRRAFRKEFPRGKVLKFSESGEWAPILTESADALVIVVEDEDIRRHGLPPNLAPVVWITAPGQFRRDYPFLAATLDHAGPGVRYRRITV